VSFDAIALWYRALETIAFGGALQRARIACLEEIEAPRRALIVGEGNGRFLRELVRRHPAIEVDCVDASERMLRLAQQRIERELPDSLNRIRFLQRDITSWTPAQPAYDLIVTHFVLDCFRKAQVADVVGRLAGAATTKAIWLLADFRIPPEGFGRARARVWLAAMYRFFQVTAGIEAVALVDPSPFLCAGGFSLARQHLFRHGMVKSQLWRRTS
jgi:cyclopropane fatty-acyl-phospholipid synthase-like methyltransferase